MPHRIYDALGVYHDIAMMLLAPDLTVTGIIEKLTEKGADLTGAQFCAFFQNVIDDCGADGWELVGMHGAKAEQFRSFGRPRVTRLFSVTAEGRGIVRYNDVTESPLYGQYGGMPKHHPQVRSYMAAPVFRDDHTVRGALLFGHADVGVFDESVEKLVGMIADLASLALDKTERVERLQEALEKEERAREQAERAKEHETLLLGELDHRVKNTLTVVFSIAQQTVRSTPDPNEFKDALLGRVQSLANNHSLLTDTNWKGARLSTLVASTLRPFSDRGGERWTIRGEDILLRSAAVTNIGMAFHELATNSIKYGALSVDEGWILIEWVVEDHDGTETLKLLWEEIGGPRVTKPIRTGFGSRLIQSIAAQFGGSAVSRYSAEGLTCTLTLPLDNIIGRDGDTPFFVPGRCGKAA
jgi:two-component sensor histidine kinase